MSTYFIGCLHLGHNNMAIHRGFKDSMEHDYYLIEQWNSIISKRDKVFILGDVTMEKSTYYHLLKNLEGIKHIVLGNHDRHQDINNLLNYATVSGPIRYKKDYWLTHIPVHPIELDGRVKYNIHAHIHDLEISNKRYINVDAKKLDFKPISFSEIVNNK